MHGRDYPKHRPAAASWELNNNNNPLAFQVVGVYINSRRVNPTIQRARSRKQKAQNFEHAAKLWAINRASLWLISEDQAFLISVASDGSLAMRVNPLLCIAQRESQAMGSAPAFRALQL